MGNVVYSIRSVRSAEYAALGKLIVEAYDTIPGATIDPDYNVELADVRRRAMLASVLVAVTETRLLGGVTYVEGGPLAELSSAGEAEIRMFAVDAAWRGVGVGNALGTACIARARRHRRTRVWLSTSPWMRDAQRLYDRLGFVRVPARDWTATSSGATFELWAYVLELDQTG